MSLICHYINIILLIHVLHIIEGEREIASSRQALLAMTPWKGLSNKVLLYHMSAPSPTPRRNFLFWLFDIHIAIQNFHGVCLDTFRAVQCCPGCYIKCPTVHGAGDPAVLNGAIGKSGRVLMRTNITDRVTRAADII